jgi:hypothetical protein
MLQGSGQANLAQSLSRLRIPHKDYRANQLAIRRRAPVALDAPQRVKLFHHHIIPDGLPASPDLWEEKRPLQAFVTSERPGSHVSAAVPGSGRPGSMIQLGL